jgi:hypothetical protein
MFAHLYVVILSSVLASFHYIIKSVEWSGWSGAINGYLLEDGGGGGLLKVRLNPLAL